MTDVGRIAGKPRAGDAVLGDVDRVHHHRRHARGAVVCRKSAGARDAQRRGRWSRAAPGPLGADGGSARASWSWITLPLLNMSLLRLTAMTMRAPSARQTDTGIGLTSAPSISQRPLICTGRKMPGSANDALSAFTRLPLLSQTSCPVPSSVATATNLRSSFSIWNSCEMMLEPGAQALPGDEARAREIDVEKAEDAAPSRRAGEILERVEPLGDEAGAGHGADRRAGDDVGLETRLRPGS